MITVEVRYEGLSSSSEVGVFIYIAEGEEPDAGDLGRITLALKTAKGLVAWGDCLRSDVQGMVRVGPPPPDGAHEYVYSVASDLFTKDWNDPLKSTPGLQISMKFWKLFTSSQGGSDD